MGPTVQTTDLIGLGLLAAGASLAAMACLAFFRRRGQAGPADLPLSLPRSSARVWVVVALGAVVLGLALRLWGLVAEHYADALKSHPAARVWVLSFLRQPPNDEMQQALAAYRVAGKVEALEASATLYEPAAPSGTTP